MKATGHVLRVDDPSHLCRCRQEPVNGSEMNSGLVVHHEDFLVEEGERVNEEGMALVHFYGGWTTTCPERTVSLCTRHLGQIN